MCLAYSTRPLFSIDVQHVSVLLEQMKGVEGQAILFMQVSGVFESILSCTFSCIPDNSWQAHGTRF